MQLSDIDLKWFEFRQKLEEIWRYWAYKPMYYRPDVFFHSKKVFHLVKAALPRIIEIFGNEVDADRMLVMALVHDDAESITWDVLAGRKAKMSEEKLKKVDIDEEDAIDILVAQCPKEIHGYNYKELLSEVLHKKTIESQIVKYIDHLDWLGEAYHEVYAGNTRFTTHYIDEQLGEIELPHEYYITRFNKQEVYYPLIGKLMGEALPFLKENQAPDIGNIIKNGSLHTLESIKLDTQNPIYERWKQVMMENLTDKELENLYIVKEQ